MTPVSEIRELTQGVVASFESGIDAAQNLIEKGLEVLDGYRAEQDAIRGGLREAMASVGSLRRKDFDQVMKRVFDFQSERELEVKKLIRDFFSRQKGLAERLRKSLGAGILEEVERCKIELQTLIEEAREEILAFQGEQEAIRKTFKEIEAHKTEVTARELKEVIEDLEAELFGVEIKQQAMGNGG